MIKRMRRIRIWGIRMLKKTEDKEMEEEMRKINEKQKEEF